MVEIAIIGSDMQEVIGTAIAIYLLSSKGHNFMKDPKRIETRTFHKKFVQCTYPSLTLIPVDFAGISFFGEKCFDQRQK